MDCIFCRIVAREIPCDSVYETEDILAFNDITPKAPVHIILIPKRHIQTVIDFKPEDDAVVLSLMKAIKHIAHVKNLPQNGFRVVTNAGQDGGQTVHHVHFHILAGRSLSWPPG